MKHQGLAKSAAPAPFESYELLTIDQSVGYVGPGISKRWLLRQIYQFKAVKTVKLNGKRLVPRSELDRLVAEGTDKWTA
jgi:hypothetical protein